MKKVAWIDRAPGDVFLSALSSLLGLGIREAEIAMHPAAPLDFVPSHAGLIGFNDTVIEAWLDLEENSVAAVNPDSKYSRYVSLGLVEVWRPEKHDELFLGNAMVEYLKAYGPAKYGILNLLGFEYEAAMEKLLGVQIDNPVHVSNVCSQGALLYLSQKYAEEYTVTQRNLRDMDPLALRMLFMEIYEL